MKKAKFNIVLSIALIFVVAITLMINNNVVAHASDISPEKVVLHGTYEATFSPDTAYVTMGVLENTTETVSEVSTLEYNPTNLDMVLSTLENNGISGETISTKKIDMPYDMFQNMRANGTKVSNMVEFKTTDIENLDTLISTLSENNASVKFIRYALEDTSASYSSVLNGAIDNATAKLNSLVPDGNYNVVEIIEEGCYSPTMYNCFSNADGEVSCDGAISLCGNVRVVFERAE